MAKPVDNITIFQKADEAIRIFRTAVRKAQEKNRRLGVANVYSINGRLYYELPNGDLSRTPPEAQAPTDARGVT